MEGSMNQKDFATIARAENCDIMGIQKCEWCNVWKPKINMRQSKMFGLDTCNNCYYNFLSMTKNIERAKALLEFCQRRLNNGIKSPVS